MWPRRARRGCCSGPISQRESAGSTGCRACSGLPAGSAAFRPGKITLRRRSPEVLHWRGRVKPLYFADVPALHGKDDRDEIVALCGFLMNRRAVAVHRYCCGTPSTANVRNVAYLSPILRTSLFAWLSFDAFALSMLSNWRITTRFSGGAPSNVAVLLNLPARYLPPASVMGLRATCGKSFL
jgi:hypothetical protein